MRMTGSYQFFSTFIHGTTETPIQDSVLSFQITKWAIAMAFGPIFFQFQAVLGKNGKNNRLAERSHMYSIVKDLIPCD